MKSAVYGWAARSAVLLATAILSGCDNPDCNAGCRDVCKPFYRAACVTEYNAGYSTGLADGLRGEPTFAVVSDARAAGYADGYADGTAQRRASQPR